MRKSSVLVGLSGLLPLCTAAQQMDMDAMMKWASADVIRYHIVGMYQTTSYVASDGSGQADISDRVVIDLTWKLSEAKLVGDATFQNTKSTANKLRDRTAACLPPVLKGDLEFYDLLAVKDGLGGALELTVRSTYPVVEVAQVCTAGRTSVPAKVDERQEQFAIPSPVMFGMPIPQSDDLSVTPDKKSFIVRKDGWVWTVTPTAVGK